MKSYSHLKEHSVLHLSFGTIVEYELYLGSTISVSKYKYIHCHDIFRHSLLKHSYNWLMYKTTLIHLQLQNPASVICALWIKWLHKQFFTNAIQQYFSILCIF